MKINWGSTGETPEQWLNSPPVSGFPLPKVFVPPPGNDVPSPFWGKSLKLLPPEVRF